MKRTAIIISAALAAFAAVIATGAIALAAVNPAVTSAQTRHMADIEKYFDQVRTMTADFTQVASNGTSSRGRLYLSKPGRLKMVYDPPDNFELIANSGRFIYHDKRLNQAMYLDISRTVANVILRDRLAFNTPGLEVTRVQESGQDIEITLRQQNDPMAGQMTLVFNLRPQIALAGWRITDAQNVTTVVTLHKQAVNVPVSRRLFDYVNPLMERQRHDPRR
ncbi:MAG: outer membrane lipoprotein carrier protein LolA [Alphaproteobacteria bacterium]|nr:outer membrane lipoprotein carrier protein LolA [Alphaproteobacteria bacterium]